VASEQLLARALVTFTPRFEQLEVRLCFCRHGRPAGEGPSARQSIALGR
jgi:hypothetical protein